MNPERLKQMGKQGRPAGGGSVRLALRLIRDYSKGEFPFIAAGLLATTATSLFALLEPWPLKLVVDSVLGEYPPPSFLAHGAAAISETRTTMALLGLLCVSIVLLKLLLGACRTLSTYFLVAVGLRMVFRLRCAVFDHVQRLSLAFHDSTTVGDSLYRVAWDTYSIQTVFNNGLVNILTSVVTLAGIAFVMFSRDWVLTLAALAFALPLILILQRVDGPIQRSSLAVHERESAVTSRVQETLSGIRVVQAFSGEERESGRFRERAEESVHANLRLTVLQSASQIAVGLLLAGGTAVVIWLAASRVMNGRMTPGDVVLLAAYVAMLYAPMETFAQTANILQQASAGAQRVFDVLETVPGVGDSSDAQDLRGRVKGHLAFDHVVFGYRDGQRILDGISLEMSPGSRIALVGASGVGKTTLASLLVRFYDPEGGRILLDGMDLRQIRLSSLRENVSVVLQDPVLFGASVRENIAYGRPGAKFEEIVEAAKAAGAHEFIEELPEGYESQVGERGVFLSGGQRQRLAIARAFLKDAPVLIMDEPTSALDTETEMKLLAALERLMVGRTTIIIAHRLSTIRNADRIVVLDQGRIVEQGRHEDLVDRNGVYRRFQELQGSAGRLGAT